ncbi:hypothetical protein M885DRAFT_436924 [Pelagophyceae sp. CCMP2097]|nr:hypothetical protein M885DRAFT_436924 [Pelagophyceae sp. CCMP2097]
MLKALETIQKRDSFAAAAAGAGAATTAPAPAKKPVLSKVQNSTGTIFLDHTLAEPDVAVALECVSRVLHAHIASDDAPVDNPAFDVFEDASGLLLDVEPEGPGLETVVAFVDHIYYSAQLYVECIVTTLILVERLLQHNEDSLRLSRSNWQAVIFTTMMLSSKLCDDESPKNADWRYVWSHFNLARINELEAGLLNALAFQVSVSASQYAMHYFHLRTIARRLGLAKAEAIMPVDVRVADRIAATSHKFCVLKSPALKKKSLVSAKSCSARTFADKTHEPKCPHATLEQLVDMTHGAAADEMALAHRRSRSSFNDHPSDQAVR